MFSSNHNYYGVQTYSGSTWIVECSMRSFCTQISEVNFSAHIYITVSYGFLLSSLNTLQSEYYVFVQYNLKEMIVTVVYVQVQMNCPFMLDSHLHVLHYTCDDDTDGSRKNTQISNTGSVSVEKPELWIYIYLKITQMVECSTSLKQAYVWCKFPAYCCIYNIINIYNIQTCIWLSGLRQCCLGRPSWFKHILFITRHDKRIGQSYDIRGVLWVFFF